MKIGMAFGGGGFKGVGSAAFLRMVESNNIGRAHFLSGVSVGAIIAVGYALGYSGKEIEQIMLKEVPKFFKKFKFPKNMNPYNPDYDDSYANEFLKKFCLDRNMCDLTKNVSILARRRSDTKSACKIFNQTDKVPVWMAIRASMAADSFFAPFTIDGVTYTDGGTITNSMSAVLKTEMERTGIPTNEIAILNIDTSGKDNQALPSSRMNKIKWAILNLETLTGGASDKDDFSTAVTLGDRFFNASFKYRKNYGIGEYDKSREVVNAWSNYYNSNHSEITEFLNKNFK